MRPDPHPARTARVVHGALMATVVLWCAGFFALRAFGPAGIPPVAPGLGTALRGVFFALVAVVVFLAVRARGLLMAPRLVEDPDVFWRENEGRVRRAWMAAEIGAVAGVVLAWLTGVTFMALGLPAVGLLALLLASPGTLRSR